MQMLCHNLSERMAIPNEFCQKKLDESLSSRGKRLGKMPPEVGEMTQFDGGA